MRSSSLIEHHTWHFFKLELWSTDTLKPVYCQCPTHVAHTSDTLAGMSCPIFSIQSPSDTTEHAQTNHRTNQEKKTPRMKEPMKKSRRRRTRQDPTSTRRRQELRNLLCSFWATIDESFLKCHEMPLLAVACKKGRGKGRKRCCLKLVCKYRVEREREIEVA